MTNLARLSAAAVAIGGLALPATAQTPYPYAQPYPQTYPSYPGYQQPYGYQNNGNVVGSIIDQLLGNRYNVTDRQAVSRCASAVMAQAQTQYRGYGNYGGHGQQSYGQGFAAPSMRVTAITEVQRRTNGLRVKGLLSSGYAAAYGQPAYGGGYANQYNSQSQGDLTFRCNVDYRGAVTNIKIGRNSAYRRY